MQYFSFIYKTRSSVFDKSPLIRRRSGVYFFSGRACPQASQMCCDTGIFFKKKQNSRKICRNELSGLLQNTNSKFKFSSVKIFSLFNFVHLMLSDIVTTCRPRFEDSPFSLLLGKNFALGASHEPFSEK